MKSTERQLESRGFVTEETAALFKDISLEEIEELLKSHKPCEVTLGAKVSAFVKHEQLLPLLCAALADEKKLYTKLAICEALAAYGESSLPYLIPLLGVIGNNQHKKAGLFDLNKKSFPLPRDIAARIIIRIGEPALPLLEDILVNGTYIQKAEAVDAIGQIAYNFKNLRSEHSLHNLFNAYSEDELICWKVIRALQSFNSCKTESLLKLIISESGNSIFTAEAERSMKQIQKRRVVSEI
jgi:hypothetical protein